MKHPRRSLPGAAALALLVLLGACAPKGESSSAPAPGSGGADPGASLAVLVQPEYDFAQEYQNGYAFACMGDDCGYLDREGNFLPLYRFPEQSRSVFLQCLMEGGLYNQLPASEEGLVPVCDEAGLWGYHDLKTGELAIPHRYKTGVPFSQGRAAVCWEEEGATRYAVIDTAGEVVFPVDGVSGGVYKNGLLAVQLPGEDKDPAGNPQNRWALVDVNGKPVVENYGADIGGKVTIYGYPIVAGSDFETTLDPEHIVLYRQSQDPQRAADSYTVINARGEVQFGDDSLLFLTGFSEGYGFYQSDPQNPRFGVMDGAGNKLSGQVLTDASHFFGGLAWFRDDSGRYGLMDPGGRVLAPAVYEDAGTPKNGRVAVKKDGKYGLVDREGKELLPFQYDYLNSDGDEVLAFGQGEKYGLLSASDGTVLAEAVYDGVGYEREGTFLVVLAGKFGFLSL